jgi:hypothetical protein
VPRVLMAEQRRGMRIKTLWRVTRRALRDWSDDNCLWKTTCLYLVGLTTRVNTDTLLKIAKLCSYAVVITRS